MGIIAQLEAFLERLFEAPAGRLGATLQPVLLTKRIERAMDTVFQSPGALRSVPTFLCAGCRKTMPCLGAPSP